MIVAQRSLFDLGDETIVGPLDRDLDHALLPGGAWIDYRRSWITGTESLFCRLLERVPWQAERRPMYDRIVDVPRLSAFYGEQDRFPDEALDRILGALRGHYEGEPGSDLRTAGMCLYRDGRDSVAWHGDRFGRGDKEDVIVAIVSLGERRTFLLRPRGGGRSLRYVLDSGDVLVMGGSCQRTWEHAVPKSAHSTGTRISVQFRTVGAR